MDDCKHIVRYSSLQVKEDTPSTNSRLPNPTTSNVEPVPSRAQESNQEAEVQLEPNNWLASRVPMLAAKKEAIYETLR